MNTKVYFGLALVGFALSSVEALFGTLAGATAGNGLALTFTGLGATTAGTTGFLTAGGALVLGGIAALKAAAIASVLARSATRRGRRSTTSIDESELAVAAIAMNEPNQCYRRLICDLATGTMPQSELDVILALFESPSSVESPKFEFASAAGLGKQLKSIEKCELRYGCPISGNEIRKALN